MGWMDEMVCVWGNANGLVLLGKAIMTDIPGKFLFFLVCCTGYQIGSPGKGVIFYEY